MCVCGSERLMTVSAKCSDLCHISLPEGEIEGYVPDDLNIGGGDYVRIEVCMDCGRVQGEWPLPQDVGKKEEEEW